jgi:hypothetical protein
MFCSVQMRLRSTHFRFHCTCLENEFSYKSWKLILPSISTGNTVKMYISSNHFMIITQTKSWGRVTSRKCLQNKNTFVWPDQSKNIHAKAQSGEKGGLYILKNINPPASKYSRKIMWDLPEYKRLGITSILWKV